MNKDVCFIINQIVESILDRKGIDPIVIDVTGICNITDYFIVAEGSVGRHVKALANTVISDLKEKGISPSYVEGKEFGDWIVIDYGVCMVHLFMPKLRKKYDLETLWSNGTILNFPTKV